jgi:hypothetical protein
MISREKPGVLRRLLGALGRLLNRGLLGKSSHGYMKQFADTGEPRGWPGEPSGEGPERSLQPGGERFQDTGAVAVLVATSLPGTARRSAEPEFEPVHGWTRRQRDDYLGRNPGYQSTYDAALQKCRDATVV